MVSLTAKSLGDCASDAGGDFEWGEVGCRITHSKYRRDYCFLCGEPIRVALDMIGLPNSCSFCQPDYRGTPGVAEAERMFWIRQYLDEAEVISA